MKSPYPFTTAGAVLMALAATNNLSTGKENSFTGKLRIKRANPGSGPEFVTCNFTNRANFFDQAAKKEIQTCSFSLRLTRRNTKITGAFSANNGTLTVQTGSARAQEQLTDFMQELERVQRVHNAPQSTASTTATPEPAATNATGPSDGPGGDGTERAMAAAVQLPETGSALVET